MGLRIGYKLLWARKIIVLIFFVGRPKYNKTSMLLSSCLENQIEMEVALYGYFLLYFITELNYLLLILIRNK